MAVMVGRVSLPALALSCVVAVGNARQSLAVAAVEAGVLPRSTSIVVGFGFLGRQFTLRDTDSEIGRGAVLGRARHEQEGNGKHDGFHAPHDALASCTTQCPDAGQYAADTARGRV